MDAPKCKICGEKHYGLCPEFRTLGATPSKSQAKAPDKPDARVAPLPRQGRQVDDAVRSGSGATHMVDAGGPRPPFDRNAYQREYMRKRRAELKAKL